MKTSDYMSVGFVAIFVTIVAYLLLNSILGDPGKATVKFEYLDWTNTGIVQPDEEVFNAAAINPTVEVYVGSCKDMNGDGSINEDDYDQDRDGTISEWERRVCGNVETDTGVTVTEENQYLEANQGLSNGENDAINNAEGYASGTTAEQRQAVENDVEQYKQEQQQQQAEEQDSASRTTVSGS